METLKSDAAPERAEPNLFAPYNSEAERDVLRAGAIFRKNREQYFVWALGYMLTFLLPDWLTALAANTVGGNWASFLLLIQYILVAPLLLCLYNRLMHNIAGDDLEEHGFFEPLHRGAGRSAPNRIAILLAVAFTLYASYTVLGRALDFAVLKLYAFVQAVYANLSGGLEVNAGRIVLYPLVKVPLFLAMGWLAGFLCMHAAVTKGERVLGMVSARGMLKKVLAAEARLLIKYLWAPFLLYYIMYPYLDGLVDRDLYDFIYMYLMPYALLGFGFWYFPQSAIARMLILMRQPRLAGMTQGPEAEPTAVTAGEGEGKQDDAHAAAHVEQHQENAGEGGNQE